jgi:predicted Zn finger-like uncharacterized protein
MLINCKYCNSKFAINAEEVGFDGRLVKCENCQKEWFQESKPKYLEKKLIELDRSLHATELHLIEQKNIHNDKIAKLEKSLIENRIFKLEKELQKNSHDSFIINTTLEKKTSDLQKKIHTDSPGSRLDDLEKELQKNSNDSLIKKTTSEEKTSDLQKIIQSDNTGGRLDNLEKELQKNSKDSFIQKTTLEEKIKETKTPDLHKLRSINPGNWDLSEETIQRELDELKSNKK